MDGKPGGFRHIDGTKFHSAFHEVRDEGHGSGKPIELGDQQGCPLPPAEFKRMRELWAIRPLTTLHLHERAEDRPADPLDVLGNHLTLCIQSETGAALPIRGNAIIGDEN